MMTSLNWPTMYTMQVFWKCRSPRTEPAVAIYFYAPFQAMDVSADPYPRQKRIENDLNCSICIACQEELQIKQELSERYKPA